MLPLLLLGLAACTPAEVDLEDDRRGTPGDSGTATDTDTDTDTDDSDSDSGSDTADTALDEATRVCNRWRADRAQMSEGTWSGASGSCDAGDVSANGRANALRLVNLYRWLSDLDPVETDATRDAKAQECALIMHANGTISHYPDASWSCYGADGAEAAARSNIATTGGVAAVDLYMADPGNSTTLGHRRWILSNGLGPVGLGSTGNYSCMWVLYGTGSDSRDWTAFPSDGPWPVEAMTASWTGVDTTGWSIQSDSIDLSGANVEITVDGAKRPVTVKSLLAGYGSASAISILPRGWSSEAGATYTVEVTGVSTPFSYEVEMVDCE